jgi:hypothetical protein
MLGASTYESFRVSTLDVKSRLRELATLVDEVTRDRVPIVSLDVCIDELVDALSTDHVTRSQLSREATLLRGQWASGKRSETNIKLLRRFLTSLHRKLDSTYKSDLEQRIIEASQKGNAKEECRQLANAYCSMLINDGYSREYLLSQVERRFFRQDIKKIEKRTLQRFFSGFDNAEREFVVILPVSKNLGSYLTKLKISDISVEDLSQLSAHAQAEFKADSEFQASHKYLVVNVKALDRYSALKTSSQFLSSMVAMTYLGRRGVDFEWHQHGYAKLKRSAEGELISNDQIVFQTHSRTLTRKVVDQLKSQTDTILKSFTPESTERLLSAINVSALSRSSPRPENQLITLWSAIEVLLSDPPRGVPRVTHYVDALTPCICIKYVRRYIIAVYDELKKSYNRHIWMFFKRAEFDQSLDPYTKFTRLLYHPELKSLHADFCKPLAGNPLALYRLWKLENNFGTKQALRNSLLAHEQRVRWQLFRIYRTRNYIVHSGRIPSFLSPLVMNVYEYYQGAAGPMLGRAASLKRRSAIDQIVAEIGFDYRMIKTDLQDGSSALTWQDILKFHK